MNDNPVANLIANFQELVSQVPDLLQPLIVAAAGAIPFIEGELATVIGVVGGLHPIVAAIAAAIGNFLAVALVVIIGARARGAIVDRANRGKEEVEKKPLSKGRQRFNRWVVRFGVPGASLLGPLAIPTHFTAATLVASGVPKGRVIFWQAMAIILWTTITTLIVSGVLAVATGA